MTFDPSKLRQLLVQYSTFSNWVVGFMRWVNNRYNFALARLAFIIALSVLVMGHASQLYATTGSGDPSAPAGDEISTASLSGFFFDPAHNGEGFVIEVISSVAAVVYWFTYNEDGSQRWFIGVGEVSGSDIIIPEWIVTSGGVFGEGFDPEKVKMDVAGHGVFRFQDCDSAVVEYTIDGEDGSQDLMRLSSIPDQQRRQDQ